MEEMEEKEGCHLSGGVFFNLLLEARKKPVISQNVLFRDLIRIYDRSAGGLRGSSLSTIASKFRKCDPDLHSEFIRFGDPVSVDAFESRLREDYDGVLEEMKALADQYLDLETNGRWLVRALLELIEGDADISDTAKFFIIPGSVLVYKKEFPEIRKIHFYSFLLSIWHFICTREYSGETGRETYLKLTEDAGASRARKFVRSRIGFSGKYDGVEVSYEVGLEFPHTESRNWADQFFSDRRRLEERDQELEKRKLERGNRFQHYKAGMESMKDQMEARANRYWTYLKRLWEKHCERKTFLYETRRPFYDFFVCSRVRKRGANGLAEIQVVEGVSAEVFPDEESFVILSGTGGQGKSMMMNHFLLQAVRDNKKTGKVPVFIPLRDYNPEKGDLMDFVFREFNRHDPSLLLSDLVQLLADGKAVLLLDGLDEIRGEYRENFLDEMNVLADHYPDSVYIISSRPNMNFRALCRFAVYDLLPFDKTQALEMIRKLDQDVVDPEIQKDFISDLENSRFRFDFKEQEDWMGNPLFLTIMLLTYEDSHDIPTQRYLFYEQAYDAMARRHDAAKALSREFRTGLDSREFQNYFGEFCAVTYAQEQYDFSFGEMEETFRDVIEMNGLHTEPGAFIEDATGKICVIYQDGGKYYFIHRSFQEYFAAYFFSRQIEQDYDAVRELLYARDACDHDSMVLPMMYAMNPQKTELCVFLPYMERMIGEWEKTGDPFGAFVRMMYPNGDLMPRCSIYGLIAEIYGIREKDDRKWQNGTALRREYEAFLEEYKDLKRTYGTQRRRKKFISRFHHCRNTGTAGSCCGQDAAVPV